MWSLSVFNLKCFPRIGSFLYSIFIIAPFLSRMPIPCRLSLPLAICINIICHWMCSFISSPSRLHLSQVIYAFIPESFCYCDLVLLPLITLGSSYLIQELFIILLVSKSDIPYLSWKSAYLGVGEGGSVFFLACGSLSLACWFLNTKHSILTAGGRQFWGFTSMSS